MASGGARIQNYLKVVVAKLTCCKEVGGNRDIHSNKNKILMAAAAHRRPRLPSPLNTAEAKILLVIEELNNFLIKEKKYEIYQSLREMVESVINELRLILDFLLDKELKEGSRLKYWISDVVEIAKGAQFIIDDRDPWNFSNLGSMLVPIYRALSETRKDILQLGVEGENRRSTITSSSPQEEGDEYVVLDLEEDVETILHKPVFPGGGDLLHTICILGMAGVGKTALARKLYNHPTTVDRYEPRVWVCVSGEWSNKELLMKLILEVVNNKDQSVLLEEMENADNQSLQWMLRQHLQDKNFLVVLGNIGKLPYCGSIYKAFPRKRDKQSRLVLTSRFQSIKFRTQTYAGNSIVEMKPLDDNRSWKLFLKMLVFGNQHFPKQLEIKGKEVLRNCHGLPLSIKEVATQCLIKRKSRSEWEELLESIDLSATSAVLELVYHGWPTLLKSHFLCLSFFNKGTSIRRKKLIQVWTAGQVIPQKEEEVKEETKFYYDREMMNLIDNPSTIPDFQGYLTTFIKLIDEFVVEVDMNQNQCIKYIRINASFHTLAMAKAEEEMVTETLKNGGRNLPSSRKPRHRAIYCSRDDFNHFTDHDECLVSLFYRGGGYFDASETYWKRFEQLRTLDFEGFGLKILPETIGALTELRYLGLRDNHMQKLPQSLGKLKNLEVLDIAQNFMLEVPDIVWKIGRLRHLYMSDIICRKPLKIDALKNLETLTYISVDNWAYKVSSLRMMTNLRELGIEVDENSDLSKLFTSLANNRKLDSLILRGFRFRSMPSLHGLEKLHQIRKIKLHGLITKLPIADVFPPWISHLSLINSRLDEDPMPQLRNLQSLKYLKLKNAYSGQQMVIPRNICFSLEVLCLEELWTMRNIRVESYLKLVKLEVKSCPRLEKIQKILNSYTTKELKIFTTRKLAAKIRKLDIISKIKHVDIQP